MTSRFCASTDPVGSSARMMLPGLLLFRAMATRCCAPPLRRKIFCSS